MKWNEGESLAFLASRTPDWQGRLSYKPPKQGKLPEFMPTKGLFTFSAYAAHDVFIHMYAQ